MDPQVDTIKAVVELSDSVEARFSETDARFKALETAVLATEEKVSRSIVTQPRMLLVVAIPSVLLSVAVAIWIMLGSQGSDE